MTAANAAGVIIDSRLPARMTGWGDNGKSGGSDFFEMPKVTEKKSSVARLLFSMCFWHLNALLSFQFTIALSFVILAGRRESRRGVAAQGGFAAAISSQNDKPNSDRVGASRTG